MKTKQDLIDKAVEIFKWCMENNSETFHVFCNFSGHVNKIDIHVHPDGYEKGGERIWIKEPFNGAVEIREPAVDEDSEGFYEYYIEAAENSFNKLKHLHSESVERNKPENIKALKQKQLEELKEKRQKEQEQLEKEIAAL